MNMKTIFSLLLFTALQLTAPAADQPAPAPTVAVYDFKGAAAAASFGSKVTALVTAGLAADTNLALVERAELTKALNEQSLGVSGMVSSDAAAKIGQLTGAKVLVAGQIIKTGDDHLVIVADIIGTETGRLFADTVEGPADNLLGLTADLSHKIAQTVLAQTASLMLPAEESHEDRIDRIVKNISGTNRPTVSVHVTQYNQNGNNWHDGTAETELGAILIKAGFKVVDENSDVKPDIELTGDVTTSWGEGDVRRGGLTSVSASIELKIRERLTGNILAFERQESTATGIGVTVVDRLAQFNVIDDLAGRVLALLAK